jgi:acyl carrier protein
VTTESEFLAKLTTIFREELEQPGLQISMETSKDTLESWDSLAHVRIVVGVERTFGIQLDVEEIEDIATVRGFYTAVIRHLQ